MEFVDSLTQFTQKALWWKEAVFGSVPKEEEKGPGKVAWNPETVGKKIKWYLEELEPVSAMWNFPQLESIEKRVLYRYVAVVEVKNAIFQMEGLCPRPGLCSFPLLSKVLANHWRICN